MDQIVENLPVALPTVDRWSDTSGYRAIAGAPRIETILVIKADHVGDFILGFDALLALRQAFPGAVIDLACAPWNVALARSLDLFGSIHPIVFFGARADSAHPGFDPDMAACLQGERYDLAIDLRIDPDTRIILRHVAATYKAGFDSPEHRDILTICLPHYLPSNTNTNIGMHQTLLMLRLVHSISDLFNRTDAVKSVLLGRVAQAVDIDLSPARGRILVACNTSSGRAVKNWPQDRFHRLVRWLANDLDCAVLLLGGDDQLAETAEIVQFCGSANIISGVGKTTIREAIGLLPQASLFIGNDSGLTHVAARVGVPTIAIFSGIDPTVMWAPIGEHVTVLRSEVACSPCHILHVDACRGKHACLQNITETSVRAAVRRHLFTARRYGQTPEPHAPARRNVQQNPMFRGWASSKQTQIPQRFDENYPRYLAQGGQLRIEQLLQGFVTGNVNNRTDMNRFYMLTLIFDQIIKEGIFGDIAELGVYQGNTATMLAALARQIGATAYLLDTFEGFDRADLAGVDANKNDAFADTSLARVQTLVGHANTRYVQGFFPGTADQIPQAARFSLVHIDCDLYAPFQAALAFFYDRLVPGGFLVMHDYSSLHWDGAERAVDEFFADKPESPTPMPDGAGTVVVRKAKRAAAATQTS